MSHVFYFCKQVIVPKNGYLLAQRLQPWLWTLTLLFFMIGLFLSLLVAPSDYQQGDVYRILFIHVPAALMSLLVYGGMATASFVYAVWKIKMADIVATVSAPIGALFTGVTLLSGALWGKPTWGTYWIWDARLTSELLLLFIYLGIMAFRSAMPSDLLAGRAVGMLTLLGLVNLPIIHYSVTWWHTLHQGPTLLRWAKPSMVPSMWVPVLWMLFAYILFYFTWLCLGIRTEMMRRERGARWL